MSESFVYGPYTKSDVHRLSRYSKSMPLVSLGVVILAMLVDVGGYAGYGVSVGLLLVCLGFLLRFMFSEITPNEYAELRMAAEKNAAVKERAALLSGAQDGRIYRAQFNEMMVILEEMDSDV